MVVQLDLYTIQDNRSSVMAERLYSVRFCSSNSFNTRERSRHSALHSLPLRSRFYVLSLDFRIAELVTQSWVTWFCIALLGTALYIYRMGEIPGVVASRNSGVGDVVVFV